ncbi:putative ligase [Streptantibioticus cattleyicolor NRRL 8057 = DSM 46488]|uniref:5-formyltetrahydrofolate cyclo-ligase n=1 Tax=Streptantibioticus cattleyicolor (strain ATCC 35852 / DSM 46488 / JCM 4925 / NBRC 14057 / NRRL 8057) TaxID=1003195 RepID=G8X2B3_STREN|nr:putative ligase [Streptantibioticus cattleyicolor NRRL 8057 = DSM 46488]MYS59188.1 5-formyltetrahydrofolate cyclo-ligase [Streptomyces sp. SID5468]
MDGAGTPGGGGPAADKGALRAQLLRRRRALSARERSAAERALAARALTLPEIATAGTVAAYVSVGGEPGTRQLLETLRERGTRVLLPVLLGDNDLDWAVYEGPGSLLPAGRGLLEPAQPPLGPDAVLAADVVLLPGLAVDAGGMRLGRGGGSYDRVLERLERAGAEPLLVVLLYAHEVVERLPAEAHDRPVHAVVTPEGAGRFTV